MATTSVEPANPSTQYRGASSEVIGESYEGGAEGNRRNGFRVENVEPGEARLILVRAGRPHDIGRLRYSATVTRVEWNRRGLEEPQFVRDGLETLAQSATAERRRALEPS